MCKYQKVIRIKPKVKGVRYQVKRPESEHSGTLKSRADEIATVVLNTSNVLGETEGTLGISEAQDGNCKMIPSDPGENKTQLSRKEKDVR